MLDVSASQDPEKTAYPDVLAKVAIATLVCVTCALCTPHPPQEPAFISLSSGYWDVVKVRSSRVRGFVPGHIYHRKPIDARVLAGTLIRRLCAHLAHHAKNKIAGRILQCLDPTSGRKIPAIWHGAGAYHGVFIPETQ